MEASYKLSLLTAKQRLLTWLKKLSWNHTLLCAANIVLDVKNAEESYKNCCHSLVRLKYHTDEFAQDTDRQVLGRGPFWQFSAPIPLMDLNAVNCLYILNLWINGALLKSTKDHMKGFQHFSIFYLFKKMVSQEKQAGVCTENVQQCLPLALDSWNWLKKIIHIRGLEL